MMILGKFFFNIIGNSEIFAANLYFSKLPDNLIS